MRSQPFPLWLGISETSIYITQENVWNYCTTTTTKPSLQLSNRPNCTYTDRCSGQPSYYCFQTVMQRKYFVKVNKINWKRKNEETVSCFKLISSSFAAIRLSYGFQPSFCHWKLTKFAIYQKLKTIPPPAARCLSLYSCVYTTYTHRVWMRVFFLPLRTHPQPAPQNVNSNN